MKILLVNWQDRLNPLGGGAEIHLHEIFGRLVGDGHRVTLLASGWEGAPQRAEVDGIEVRRVGRRYTFNLHAPRCGRRLLAREQPDVVVEALNKVPTFAPLWSGSYPVVPIVHHLFGGSAFREANPALAAATWLLERPIPWFYRGLPAQAISQSTADDLARRGLKHSDVRVIHPGVDLGFFTPHPEGSRAAEPTFLYVGRLRRYKGVDLILRAVALHRGRGGRGRVVVAGRGEWEGRLRQLAQRLQLGDGVEFLGWVSEERKRELLRQAWANLFVSPKEGWGITNIEAAACGTATVASDAPGLRESVLHGRTGILVPHGDVAALAAALDTLAADPRRVDALGREAHRFAQGFSWDAAAQQTLAHLEEVIGLRTPGSRTSVTRSEGEGVEPCDR